MQYTLAFRSETLDTKLLPILKHKLKYQRFCILLLSKLTCP